METNDAGVKRALAALSSGGGESREATCRITLYEPGRVVVEVDQLRPGLLVLADYFYPGWQAEIVTADDAEPRPAEILRTNRVMRAVALPAGTHRIVFRYRPKSVLVGAAISGLTTIALTIAAVIALVRRRTAQAG